MDFEDDHNVLLVDASGNPSTGNFNVDEGTMFVQAGTVAQALLRTALEAGNLGRAGAEIRLGDGGAFYLRTTRGSVHTIPQAIKTTTSGKSYLVLQRGDGSGDAEANFTNVTLANGSTLELNTRDNANEILRATINATAGGGAIENNINDSSIHVTINAGSQPITFHRQPLHAARRPGGRLGNQGRRRHFSQRPPVG